ncbi:MAG: RnfH family protein, partial [Gammaproteobacteria bacterium]
MSPRHSGQQTWITVEVAYASAEKQRIISLEVPQGTTALEAAQQSGIKEEFGSIDFVADSMGIFSEILDGKQRPRPEEYVLQDGDRVEIYRPLLIDPKS